MTLSATPNNEKPEEKSAKKLISDIKPTPTKDRSQQGVVEIILDEGTKVQAVGVIYGFKHQISGDGFKTTIFLDHYNQRVRILNYEVEDFANFMGKIRWLCEANNFDKAFAIVPRSDWQKFLRHGWVLEAVIKYYLAGEDGYVVSKFRSQERLTSPGLMEETLLIEEIMEKDPSLPASIPTPDGYEFRLATRDDVPELIKLYKQIFESYPSPLIYTEYLQAVFSGDEALFLVATHHGEIVSVASAEMLPQIRSAELSDCATHPKARGKGLMSIILSLLQEELRKRDYICAFTMARGRSYGMNNVFYQMGFEFMGRLVNNCDIYGAFEDMNIWVKNLVTDPKQTVDCDI